MGFASYKSKALTFKDDGRLQDGFAAANCAAVFQIDGWEAVTPWLPSVIPSEVEESLIIVLVARKGIIRDVSLRST
jgi:hypothetical protein